VLICLCTFSLTAPIPTPVMQPQNASCCIHLSGQPDTHECGHQPLKPKQDFSCCAACPIGPALFVPTSTPFIFSVPDGENLAIGLSRGIVRHYRPLVPPPRSLVT